MQPDLQSMFQGSKDYTDRSCLEKQKQNKESTIVGCRGKLLPEPFSAMDSRKSLCQRSVLLSIWECREKH